MLLHVGGARRPFPAALLDLLSGSSLLPPPAPPLLPRMLSPTLLLLSESSSGGRRERGDVGLCLAVARLSALSHGEVPQRPLLVAAGSPRLGRAAGSDVRRGGTETVLVAAAAWGDGGLGGGGRHRGEEGAWQGLQMDLTSIFQLQKEQDLINTIVRVP